MKISILTATYNRAKLLDKLYNSIVKNLSNQIEVEWLIMDDGSKDDTKDVVNKYINSNKFIIKYYWQENQGKMIAINNLIQYSSGDLIIECDSDDYLRDNAFEIIKNNYNEIDDETYALCFLKYDQNECNIGKLFTVKDTTIFDLYFKYGETGDKSLVFNAKIRKQYKYEVENGERFITEGRMYHKMDLKYKIKCFNEPIMICEYKEDGYSKNIIETFKKYPYGYYKYFEEMFTHNMKGVLLKKRLYLIKHYILFSVLTKKKFKEMIKNVLGIKNKLLVTLLYLPGKIVTRQKFQ